MKIAKTEWNMFKRRTLLFIDEIHRFNKTQQDALLPHVEDGTVIFLGATTENPSFSLNSALLSRCRVVSLTKLSMNSLESILKKAIVAKFPEFHQRFDVETVKYLACLADGDARYALNSLETIMTWLTNSTDNADENQGITVEVVKTCLSKNHIKYDCKGDDHFYCGSALQKSIRGSAPDASLYWTMRMLEGGEKPEYIARRFIRIASEDIGLADPGAMGLAVSTMQGCQMIGRPECDVLLAQCVIYLAKAPKSHLVYAAMQRAQEHIKKADSQPPVPLHLRNATSNLDREAGFGVGYTYDLSKNQDLCYMPAGMEKIKFL